MGLLRSTNIERSETLHARMTCAKVHDLRTSIVSGSL